MSGRHPSESDLALLAGGDCNWLQRLRLNGHVSKCGDCQDTVASFGELRASVRDIAIPPVVANEAEWERLAGEMRANVRLGLAAGACVASIPEEVSGRSWNPRLAYGMACVALLAGAGMFLRGLLPHTDLPSVHAAVLESNGRGVEVRTASGSSMTLLNRSDATPDQTVTSQGAIRAKYVDGTTGTVTITSVYVE